MPSSQPVVTLFSEMRNLSLLQRLFSSPNLETLQCLIGELVRDCFEEVKTVFCFFPDILSRRDQNITTKTCIKCTVLGNCYKKKGLINDTKVGLKMSFYLTKMR